MDRPLFTSGTLHRSTVDRLIICYANKAVPRRRRPFTNCGASFFTHAIFFSSQVRSLRKNTVSLKL
jgi:hypothetical protein